MSKEIVLANPRGFCAGVDRAIDIVEKSLKKFDQPVFVRHQVVHNKKVVEDLEKKGVKFVKEIEEIPDNAVAIFSAHGVSKAVEDEARQRKFMYFDATCPLVTKVHLEVQRHARKGRDIILIGHKGHPEVIGTLGRHPEDSDTNIYLVENHDDINKLEINSEELAGAVFSGKQSMVQSNGSVLVQLKLWITSLVTGVSVIRSPRSIIRSGPRSISNGSGPMISMISTMEQPYLSTTLSS